MRCLIYSVNRLFGECLCAGLSAHQDVAFAMICPAADDVAQAVDRHRITTVLIDLADPDAGQVIRPVRQLHPGLCILALSVDDTAAQEVVGCARAGCHGMVPKNAALGDVVRIIAAAERGEVAMRPEVAAGVLRALAEPDQVRADQVVECLTRREREICTLIADGLTNKEIAREVNRSVGTVKNHVSSILSKLDLPRRGAIHSHLSQTPRISAQP